jgi:ABC-2 type transport system ATP-binding protein
MFAIEIKNLSKVYPKRKQENETKVALNNLNLQIPIGSFYALLGENGAGKTTTIGILTSLVNKTTGTVKIMGIDIDKDFPKAKSYLGVVPQNFNFNIFEQVLDIVITQAGYYGIPYTIAKPRAVSILNDLGLGDKLNNTANTLSGGMQRRLMIARALIHQPRILILDEPTAGVDVSMRHGMWQYLKKINQEQGVTILLTTHYLEEVEELCSRAAILNKGNLIIEDSVEALVNSVDQETYILEISQPYHNHNTKYGILNSKTSQQGHTELELNLPKGTSINTVFSDINNQKIDILSLRPKGNRMENLMLKIIN